MIVHVFGDASQVAKAAASILSAQILRKPDSVLGLATGATPVATYERLVKLHKKGILDFSGVTTFNLDEYVGLPSDHQESYISFMKRHLFDQVNLKASYLPDGNAKDLAAECQRYEELITSTGGIDLQLLGIGSNGHIGFNEPGDNFVFGTNLTDLTQSTIEANKRFFDSADQVPRQAISMGIGTILSAQEILLLAMGKNKAEAVLGMVRGDITPKNPSSILKGHPRVTVLLDEDAASLL